MNIKIFLLKNDSNSYARRLEPQLAHLFAAYLPAEGGVQEFPSFRDAADAVSQAFKDAHAILFFASPELFADTKRLLTSSIGLQLRCDGALLERANAAMQTAEAEDSEFALAHAYVPENARAIGCEDGLYTGFSVSSGNQTAMLLPLERGRTDVLLAGSVIPMLNSAYMIRADIGSLNRYNAERLLNVCEENDLRIAVAGTNTAEFFKEYISSAEGLADRVSFAAKAEKRGEMSPADYVVNLSITAAEFFGTPYGVAISNAFYSGSDPSGEKIIYLAITNEYETALREVRSVPGEDIPSLLSRCCGDLCTFISDIAGTDAEKRTVSQTNEKSLVSQYKRVIGVVAAVVLILAVFAGVYFTMNGYTLKEWASNAWNTVFPGSKPIFTTEPQTTETTTESAMAEVTTKRIAITTGTTKQDASTTSTTKAATTSRSSSSGSSSSSTSRSSSSSTAAPTEEPSSNAPTENSQETTASQEPSSDETTESQEPSSSEVPTEDTPTEDTPTSSEEPSGDSEPEPSEDAPAEDGDPEGGEQENG